MKKKIMAYLTTFSKTFKNNYYMVLNIIVGEDKKKKKM